MGVLAITRIILIDHFLIDYTVLLPQNLRTRLASRFYLIFIHLRRCVGSLKQSKDILDVAVGRRDVHLLQILNHLAFPPLANLTNLAVHKRRPHLVAALTADLTP